MEIQQIIARANQLLIEARYTRARIYTYNWLWKNGIIVYMEKHGLVDFDEANEQIGDCDIGVMELLKPYIDGGALVVLSGKMDYSLVKVDSWTIADAKETMLDRLASYDEGACPDMVLAAINRHYGNSIRLVLDTCRARGYINLCYLRRMMRSMRRGTEVRIS